MKSHRDIKPSVRKFAVQLAAKWPKFSSGLRVKPDGHFEATLVAPKGSQARVLSIISSWMAPGLILMDEPEAALSPQRQLSLLAQMVRLVHDGGAQFIIATHSPILMTYPEASLLSFDGDAIKPTRLEDTSHFQITKGILDSPGRYWKHLLKDDEPG